MKYGESFGQGAVVENLSSEPEFSAENLDEEYDPRWKLMTGKDLMMNRDGLNLINNSEYLADEIAGYVSDEYSKEQVEFSFRIGDALDGFYSIETSDFLKYYMSEESKKSLGDTLRTVRSKIGEAYDVFSSDEVLESIKDRSRRVVESVPEIEWVLARQTSASLDGLKDEAKKNQGRGIAYKMYSSWVGRSLGDGAEINVVLSDAAEASGADGKAVNEEVRIYETGASEEKRVGLVAHESTHSIQQKEVKRLLGDVMYDECQGMDVDEAFAKSVAIIAERYLAGELNDKDKHAALCLMNQLDYSSSSDRGGDAYASYRSGYNEAEAFAVQNEVDYNAKGGDQIRKAHPELFADATYCDMMDRFMADSGMGTFDKLLKKAKVGGGQVESMQKLYQTLADSFVMGMNVALSGLLKDSKVGPAEISKFLENPDSFSPQDKNECINYLNALFCRFDMNDLIARSYGNSIGISKEDFPAVTDQLFSEAIKAMSEVDYRD